MINLDLNVKLRDATPEQEEQARMALRAAVLRYVFDTLEGKGFQQHQIFVEGDIKITEPEMTRLSTSTAC